MFLADIKTLQVCFSSAFVEDRGPEVFIPYNSREVFVALGSASTLIYMGPFQKHEVK